MNIRQLILSLTVFSAVAESTDHAVADEPKPVNYLYPAKDLDPKQLKTDDQIIVTDTTDYWSFLPVKEASSTGLLFFPGGGVEPTAYAPLLRSVAVQGRPVYLVKLPGKPEAPDKHRQSSITQGKAVIKATTDIKRWVVAGHSMGASIAAKFVHEEPKQFRGLVLIATTHPRDVDISAFAGAVTKVYGTEDTVAKQSQSEANKKLLPATTTWVKVEGGNHAQFGEYGAQLGDGKATINRAKQQQQTTAAIIELIKRADALTD